MAKISSSTQANPSNVVKRDYGLFYLSGQQTTELADTNPVKYNTVGLNSGIGFDPANYRWTLKAGKSYICRSVTRYSFSAAGYAAFQFYNITTSAYVGTQGRPVSASYTGHAESVDECNAMFSLSTDNIIEVRTLGPVNIDGIFPEYSFVSIQEVENSAPRSNVPMTAAVEIPVLDVDWSTGNIFTKTIGVSSTFTFSGQVSGQTIIIRVTTSGSYTATWPTVKWPGGTVPTQTASGTDVYTFFYDGTNIYGTQLAGMA